MSNPIVVRSPTTPGSCNSSWRGRRACRARQRAVSPPSRADDLGARQYQRRSPPDLAVVECGLHRATHHGVEQRRGDPSVYRPHRVGQVETRLECAFQLTGLHVGEREAQQSAIPGPEIGSRTRARRPEVWGDRYVAPTARRQFGSRVPARRTSCPVTGGSRAAPSAFSPASGSRMSGTSSCTRRQAGLRARGAPQQSSA